MKKTLLFIGLIMLASVALGQQYTPIYGKPVLVLIEENPWLMVMGSDVPTFAAYENGQIIYQTTSNKVTKLYQVRLSKEELQNTIRKLGQLDDLKTMPGYISASSWTDQPNNIIIFNDDTAKEVDVYGNIRNPNNESRKKAPQVFLTIYDNIISFKSDSAKEWMPDNVEVMLTGYSYAPEKSMPWPKEWPDLKTATTVKRSEDFYSLYMDKKYFDPFIKLLKSLKEKQAVLINGQKFSVSYRLPFPNLK